MICLIVFSLIVAIILSKYDEVIFKGTQNPLNNKATKSNIKIENKRCKETCVYEIKKEWRKCNVCRSVETQYDDRWVVVFNEDGITSLDINLPTILSGGKKNGCQVIYYGYNPKKDLRVEIAAGGSCPYDYINWNENKQKLVGKHSWIKEVIDDRYCKLYGTEEIFAFITLIPTSNKIVHMKDTIFNINKPKEEQIAYCFSPAIES